MPTTTPPLIIQTFAITKSFPPASGGWRTFTHSPAPKSQTAALHQVSLSVQEGELFGLLGPNGAGKSTLIKILCTLILPTSGTAVVRGWPLSHEREIKNSLGMVTSDDRSFYWRLTGQQNLEFFGALHDLTGSRLRTRIAETLALVGLEAAARQTFQTYSSGMRQRLAIARALLHEPPLLFLDEPTRGLDPAAVLALHRLIREDLTSRRGITVFLSTHNLAEAEKLCDRVAVLHRGEVRGCGTLPELRTLIGAGERYVVQARGLSPETANRLAAEGLTASQAVDPAPDQPLLLSAAEAHLNRAIDLLRAGGAILQRIHLEQAPLEEIFARLTSGDVPVPAPAPAAPAPAAAAPPGRKPALVLTGFLRAAWAFLKRDFQTERSYRFAMLLQAAGAVFSLGVFYFIAGLVNSAALPALAPYGGNYFSFVLIGLAYLRYMNVGLVSYSGRLRANQAAGTLEAMLAAPIPLAAIVFALPLWDYLMTTVWLGLYLAAGAAFLGVGLAGANYAGAAAAILLSLGVFGSLGLLTASAVMVFKRGESLAGIFSAIFTALGGAFFPTDMLPGWLAAFGEALPSARVLHALRLAFLQSASTAALLPDLLALAGHAALLLPLSLLAFRLAVRQARRDGSLTHF